MVLLLILLLVLLVLLLLLVLLDLRVLVLRTIHGCRCDGRVDSVGMSRWFSIFCFGCYVSDCVHSRWLTMLVDLRCLDYTIHRPQTPISSPDESTGLLLLLLGVGYRCIVHLLLLPTVARLLMVVVVTQGHKRSFDILGTVNLQYNRVGLEGMASLLSS